MLSSEERLKLVARVRRERTRYENKNLGGFTRIYPLDGIVKFTNLT